MVAAAVGIGSAVAGAASSIYGGSTAASGASKSADTSAKMYQYTAQQENPYVNAGYITVDPQAALAQYTSNQLGGSPYLTAATANMPQSVVTENWLQNTPGYQWQLSQGLKAVQSAAAARGLGVSGASLKGAATYATGLADSNYQNQFNNAQTTFTDWLNQNKEYYSNLSTAAGMLNQVSTLGQNAASATGTAGTSLANTAGQGYTNAANATAAGYTGASNALNQGVQNYLSYDKYQTQTSPTTGGFGGSSGSSSGPVSGSGGNPFYGNTMG